MLWPQFISAICTGFIEVLLVLSKVRDIWNVYQLCEKLYTSMNKEDFVIVICPCWLRSVWLPQYSLSCYPVWLPSLTHPISVSDVCHIRIITWLFFWFWLPTEQDAFIIVSFTPKDDPQDSTENMENKTTESPRSSKQWFYDPIDRDEEGEEEASDEEVSESYQ